MSATLTFPFARSPREFNEGEEGMLSLASLFVVLGFLLLIALLGNAGTITSRKLETQNAADSVAYSASVEMARGMNAITANNHLIGELTAVVILIHAMGGDQLDGKADAPSTPKSLAFWLELWHGLAKVVGEDTVQVDDDIWNDVKKDSQLGGAIYDARMRLKQVYIWAMQAHAIGGVIAQGQFIPIVGPALEGYGDSIMYRAEAFENKIDQEWQTIDELESFTTSYFQNVKTTLLQIIPVLDSYSDFVVMTMGLNVNQAVSAMGTPNAADVALYPLPILVQLPVEREPTQINDQAKSQLVRAATPWVQWWRLPWMQFGRDYLRLSRFACSYQDETTKWTLPIIAKLKQEQSINLYIISGLKVNAGIDKTNEPWTKKSGSSDVDQMFCVLGMAHRPSPNVYGWFFRQENPDGVVCYAQAMTYNANPEQPGSGNGTWQPAAGWDTLNWGNQVPEHPGPGSPDDACGSPNVSEPVILLNWQAKLVPTTRLEEAYLWQTGSTGNVLRRVIPGIDLNGTH